MTRQSIIRRAEQLERPDIAMVGRYPGAEGWIEFPVSNADLDRDTTWVRRVLETYDLAPGSHALKIGLGSEAPWTEPLQDALRQMHVIYSNAEAWGWDSRRSEMFLRRLEPVMLLGLNAEVFNGLAGMVDPAERLGTVRHLLVRPDAYDAALGAALTPRLIALVGPALGMECVHGTGMHVNPDEWTLDEDSGGLVISSTARRAADLDRAPLVLSGRVVDSACPCGLPGPRIELRPAL